LANSIGAASQRDAALLPSTSPVRSAAARRTTASATGRHLGVGLIIAIALWFAAGITAPAAAQAMKGWELYSWREGADWRFAIHLGTNRTKTCDEIKNPKAAHTLAEIETALANLARPPGEEVYWEPPHPAVLAGDCELAYPPSRIVAQIERRVGQLGFIFLRCPGLKSCSDFVSHGR
jgi:hypothetical protein